MYPLELKHVIIGFVLSDLCYVFIIILGVIAKGDSKIILYCVVFDAATTLETKQSYNHRMLLLSGPKGQLF